MSLKLCIHRLYDGTCSWCTDLKINSAGQEIKHYRARGEYAVTEGFKICSYCKKEKAIAEFSKDKYKLDGKKYFCKACEHQIYLERKNEIQIKNFNSIL